MKSIDHDGDRVIAELCPLCGQPCGEPFVRNECSWVRCGCGLIYKTTEPAAAGARSGYGEAYFETYRRRRRHRIAKARTQILDALEHGPAGPLLDVGCSLGYALEAARSLGLDACGVDLSEHAVAACRALGLSARVGSLEALPFADRSFSIVVMKHVLEHTPAPRRALAEVSRVLRPHGVVFMAVPNADYFKAVRSPQTSRFFRGEGGSAHYVYYTVATLGRLLEEEQLRVAAVHPCLVHRHAGGLRWARDVATLRARKVARAIAQQAGLRKEFWMVAVRGR
ncbi:MAG: class I SAM-dependent methyltransferase [Deltaproteobacteria bacterium]|nr:class I SAM-dependent methyltransferase [Deltaproteobacteria bacterium]